MTTETPNQLTKKERSELYENGKHRRYALLFSVNGGAFAIAKIMAVKPDGTLQCLVLGGLSLKALAYGMMAFTALMFVDIFVFGWFSKEDRNLLTPPFTIIGMSVLFLICALIFCGWWRVSDFSLCQ